MMNAGWGRIVFMASEAGINVPVDSLHYGATKAAVLALSRGFVKLAGRSGVTVNAVLPGVIMSEWVEAMVQEAAHAAVTARYPTSIRQRIHAVGEVTNLVVYLCSLDDGSFRSA